MSRKVRETNTEPETRPVLIHVEIVDQGWDEQRATAPPDTGFLEQAVKSAELRAAVQRVATRAVERYLAEGPPLPAAPVLGRAHVGGETGGGYMATNDRGVVRSWQPGW